MAGCFSFAAARDRWHRRSFSRAGLRSATVRLHGGATTVRCWAPRAPNPAKPCVVLIHGFGANATWQWDALLRPLLARFNVYVPDLLFFGGSFSARPERTESFQAGCMAAAMDALGVRRASLVGISYGAFVGYRLAAEYPDRVDRVALCCAGVCLEEKDLGEGLFAVDDLREAAAILIPRRPADLCKLMDLSLVHPPRRVPSCFLSDFIQVMCMDYVEEKTELLRAIIKDRKLSELPKIPHETLILWAEKDQIFPLELGHRLNRHLEGNSRLVIIKNAGHAVNIEKPKEFSRHLKAFLLAS
ncbi:alpha/beta-Hydrolases superfamily protein isoform X2 [Wolffia australiana]